MRVAWARATCTCTCMHMLTYMHVLHVRVCVHTCLHVMPMTIMNVHIAGLHCRGALRATLRPAHRGRVRQRAPNTDGRSLCYAHTAAVLTAHNREHMRALPRPRTAAAASPSPHPGSSPRSPPSASPPSARRHRTRTPRRSTTDRPTLPPRGRATSEIVKAPRRPPPTTLRSGGVRKRRRVRVSCVVSPPFFFFFWFKSEKMRFAETPEEVV